ncbi:MAG TPA: ribosome biogenesis GTP-binding protein YihA/YsxC [Candidatus Binatia bacterium]|nr:ribosome biogenesis GTP-binding protein YihA/YsxC [Candidatus Binatia bacterium]
MNVKKTRLAGTFFNLSQLPDDARPKVLFFGRSNVGKSSLINALLGQKLAKTSSTPGKTLSINYYEIDGKWLFADMPGYGFAKVGKSEAVRVKKLINDFLHCVRNVRLAALLIDSRRGFLPQDLETLEQILENNFPVLTILTKSDKISFSEQKDLVTKLHKNSGLHAISFSTKSAPGKYEIWKYINEAIKE